MNFNELITKVNDLDVKDSKSITEIVNQININDENFDGWVDNIFSDEALKFNMGKLPYIIDELYKSKEQFKFMLGCMLLESTCDTLEFVTPLQRYKLFKDKFDVLRDTLVTVYDRVDNGIANCMSLIILKNDNEFKTFDNESKDILIKATRRKLTDILEYLKNDKPDESVFFDIEVIVDMACYLRDAEVSRLVDEIDRLRSYGNADIYIIKYKLINNLSIVSEKYQKIVNNSETLLLMYGIMEKLNINTKYLGQISQAKLAELEMIDWLKYPTELGSSPDKIELLGEFVLKNEKFFAFKFSKNDFSIKGDLIGVSGGYPLDKVSSFASGFTFSKFEAVNENWQEQAASLVNFIQEQWSSQKN